MSTGVFRRRWRRRPRRRVPLGVGTTAQQVDIDPLTTEAEIVAPTFDAEQTVGQLVVEAVFPDIVLDVDLPTEPLDVKAAIVTASVAGGEAPIDAAPLDVEADIVGPTFDVEQLVAEIEAGADLPATTLGVEIPVAPLDAEAEIVAPTYDAEQVVAELDIEADIVAKTVDVDQVAAPLDVEADLPAVTVEAAGGIDAAPLDVKAEITAVTQDVEQPAVPLDAEANLPAVTVEGVAEIDAVPLDVSLDVVASTYNAEQVVAPLDAEVDLPAATIAPPGDEIVVTWLAAQLELVAPTLDADQLIEQLFAELGLVAPTIDAEQVVTSLDIEADLPAVAGRAGILPAPLEIEPDLPPAAVGPGFGPAPLAAPPLNPQAAMVAVTVAQTGDELRVTKMVTRVVAGTRPEVVPVEIDGDTVLLSLVPHNWITGATVETSFLTDVTKTATGREERSSLRGKPLRVMSYLHSGLTRDDARRIIMNALRSTATPVPVPLYSDGTRLTAAAGATATVLEGDFRWRRFFRGARVVVHSWGARNRPTNPEVLTILSVAVGGMSITVEAPGVVTARAAGDRVYPLVDCDVSTMQGGVLLNDEQVDFSMDFIEAAGASSLPATITDYAPWSQLADGLPVFDLSPNWYFGHAFVAQASGVRTSDGRASRFSPTGAGPDARHVLHARELSREEVWDVVQFFESRRGRARPFWVVGPHGQWEPTAIVGSTVYLTRVGDWRDIRDFVPYVAFVMRDGTLVIRQVLGVADNGTNVLVGVAGDPAVNVADVRKMAPAWKVRLTTDTLREVWETDEACSMDVSVVEVDDSEQHLSGLRLDEDRTLRVTKVILRALGD